jgi:hypothetical protein
MYFVARVEYVTKNRREDGKQDLARHQLIIWGIAWSGAPLTPVFMPFSFKVVRSQLGKHNPYYTPVSKDDENAEQENAGWTPLPDNKHGM